MTISTRTSCRRLATKTRKITKMKTSAATSSDLISKVSLRGISGAGRGRDAVNFLRSQRSGRPNTNARIEREQDRLDDMEERLVAKYARLEKMLQMINSQMGALGMLG